MCELGWREARKTVQAYSRTAGEVPGVLFNTAYIYVIWKVGDPERIIVEVKPQGKGSIHITRKFLAKTVLHSEISHWRMDMTACWNLQEMLICGMLWWWTLLFGSTYPWNHYEWSSSMLPLYASLIQERKNSNIIHNGCFCIKVLCHLSMFAQWTHSLNSLTPGQTSP